MSDEQKETKTKKFPFKQVMVWVSLFVIVFIITNIYNKINSSEATSTTAVEEKVETKVATATMGKPLTVKGTTITVSSIEKKEKVKSDVTSKKAKGEYLILDVSIKNSGKQPVIIDSNMFVLKMGETVFSSDDAATLYTNNNEPFFMQLLNPGLEMKGHIAFDVPKGLDGFTLQVASSIYDSSYVEIILK